MQTLASSCADSTTTTKRQWIIGPFADFFLLQSAAGIALLPMAYFAYCLPESWSTVFIVWTVAFSLTHQSATYARLLFDPYCRKEHKHLYLLTPALIGSAFILLLQNSRALPVVASLWLFSQVYHVAAQQYGINRRYIRLAGSLPEEPINRLSELIIMGFPWLALSYALSFGDKKLFWYPLALAPQEIFGQAALAGAFIFAAIAAAYFLLEIKAYKQNSFVPGRLLCVLSTISVNAIAWVLVSELSWAYVTLSIWHCLQYLAYNDQVRRLPPPGFDLAGAKSGFKYAAAIAGISALTWLLFQLAGSYGVMTVAVLQLSLAFHHYASDALIWRKRIRAI